ncbi:MAG TPA: branched-chain amino acid ABC transporter substrate-binding protein [Aggregatilineales bacterium]|nr:branched-chain amino acid ABC transporter substrate-binding protein [Aggregatilineales bacterium]
MIVIPPGDTIKVGVAASLSGTLEEPGIDIVQAVQLAIADFNEASAGIQGFPVELVVEDDLCTEEGAIPVANGFVESGDMTAVIGHMCSDASIAASNIYEEARIPMVSPSTSAGFFTARNMDVTNRVSFNDNIQGFVAARYMLRVLLAKKIVVLHNQTSYGEGLADTVSLTFELEGGEVLAFEAIDPQAEDYSDIIDLIEGLDPDLIYLGGYDSEASRLMIQIRAREALQDVLFFSDDGVFNQDYIDFAGTAGEGTYITFGQFAGDAAALEAFNERYEMTFGIHPDDLGPFHAAAYDAARIILVALEKVAELDAADNLRINREALITAIRETSDYNGLTGTITCDAFGDCGSTTIVVFRIENGKWVEIRVPESLQMTDPG